MVYIYMYIYMCIYFLISRIYFWLSVSTESLLSQKNTVEDSKKEKEKREPFLASLSLYHCTNTCLEGAGGTTTFHNGRVTIIHELLKHHAENARKRPYGQHQMTGVNASAVGVVRYRKPCSVSSVGGLRIEIFAAGRKMYSKT